jgi:hypothetical protein
LVHVMEHYLRDLAGEITRRKRTMVSNYIF